MRIGVDVGGTFTDAVLIYGAEVWTAKSPPDRGNPALSRRGPGRLAGGQHGQRSGSRPGAGLLDQRVRHTRRGRCRRYVVATRSYLDPLSGHRLLKELPLANGSSAFECSPNRWTGRGRVHRSTSEIPENGGKGPPDVVPALRACPWELQAPAAQRQRPELHRRRTGRIYRSESYEPCAWRPVPPADTGQDRAGIRPSRTASCWKTTSCEATLRIAAFVEHTTPALSRELRYVPPFDAYFGRASTSSNEEKGSSDKPPNTGVCSNVNPPPNINPDRAYAPPIYTAVCAKCSGDGQVIAWQFFDIDMDEAEIILVEAALSFDGQGGGLCRSAMRPSARKAR
jgi:hypothetical protein